ncbi:MAG: long-chain fatty acid--CoA ligase [Cyclobacteriaceae bacterium]|nr:long-chain fatty acid--CoA ligase [Cyclobacteriaceae bacterium]
MEIIKRPSIDFTRVFDIIRYQSQKYPNQKSLNTFESNSWRSYSIQEIGKNIDAVSGWLIENGYTKGEKIIFVPILGRPEWMILDYACQQAGLISVPVHPTSRSEEIEMILNETEARLCITADPELAQKISLITTSAEQKIKIFHIDSKELGYFEPLRLKEVSSGSSSILEALKSSISESDVFTILYTSGSSGIPKGVMLTHRNIIHNIKSVLTLLPIEPGDRVISFLPFSHIFERMTCYTYMAFGVSLYFSQNKDSFVHDFRTVQPNFCTSVPRVLEKMYDFLEEQMLDKSFIKRKIVTWALEVGKEYGSSARVRPIFAVKLFLARILVLNKWRKKLGRKIRYMVVGAASLRPEIGRLFSATGIKVIEGYGMTETAPLITMNRFDPGLNRFGTVGLPIPGIDIRIDEPDEDHQGEILVKGPNVTQGYFKRPEITKEAFTEDGWFRTGDIGKFVHGHFLKITDRKKEIFKTSSGKYIAPAPLQNHFTRSLFIERCLIIGFQRPFVTALIVPNMPILEAWCNQESIHWTSPQFMVHNIKVRARFQEEIDALNNNLPNVERIRNFTLCHEDWSIEKGELTTTLKPVRRLLEENYKGEVTKMYES